MEIKGAEDWPVEGSVNTSMYVAVEKDNCCAGVWGAVSHSGFLVQLCTEGKIPNWKTE